MVPFPASACSKELSTTWQLLPCISHREVPPSTEAAPLLQPPQVAQPKLPAAKFFPSQPMGPMGKGVEKPPIPKQENPPSIPDLPTKTQQSTTRKTHKSMTRKTHHSLSSPNTGFESPPIHILGISALKSSTIPPKKS